MENTLVLEKGKDMSLSRFIDWLNEKFKKKSGKLFNAQDAYGYIKRTNLPYHLGIYKIKETNYPEFGLKIINVKKIDTEV